MSNFVYKPRTFDLSGLNGISDGTLAMHFKLYEGYVTNTNLLNERIAELSKGELAPRDMPVISELTRRLGFEYNGMVLHEWYFGNLKKSGSGDPDKSSAFYQAAEASFGSYEHWKKNFVTVGKMRGVGWAATYYDPVAKRLSNHWINLHETGNVAGFVPVLIMDVWEHAFIRDYAPADRPKYIEAFFSNIDWAASDERLAKGGAARPVAI
ncbi:MAG TPA: Fe-Mn family superoxide dismutase [Blastocatellia bacterium]|nr:Fe-Mn family superoxide dismutase [Blastocatellia bacterium]